MKVSEIVKLRHQLGMTQAEFWGQIDVKQGPASKYERGMSEISRHVIKLVELHYIHGIDTRKINAGNAPIIRKVLAGMTPEQAAQEVYSEVMKIAHSANLILLKEKP